MDGHINGGKVLTLDRFGLSSDSLSSMPNNMARPAGSVCAMGRGYPDEGLGMGFSRSVPFMDVQFEKVMGSYDVPHPIHTKVWMDI